ncbi:hypothetical protein TCON_1004 [Astathelohania contejeani]|uniref:Uncharacterized protein n=1 Tax=Astathelohania contejeani TaxID=164912 RepID=A0ABQ7I0A3_9MICR|nr:hypothetical protein TCON_1004 [Thelohania contejeani]
MNLPNKYKLIICSPLVIISGISFFMIITRSINNKNSILTSSANTASNRIMSYYKQTNYIKNKMPSYEILNIKNLFNKIVRNNDCINKDMTNNFDNKESKKANEGHVHESLFKLKNSKLQNEIPFLNNTQLVNNLLSLYNELLLQKNVIEEVTNKILTMIKTIQSIFLLFEHSKIFEETSKPVYYKYNESILKYTHHINNKNKQHRCIKFDNNKNKNSKKLVMKNKNNISFIKSLNRKNKIVNKKQDRNEASIFEYLHELKMREILSSIQCDLKYFKMKIKECINTGNLIKKVYDQEEKNNEKTICINENINTGTHNSAIKSDLSIEENINTNEDDSGENIFKNDQLNPYLNNTTFDIISSSNDKHPLFKIKKNNKNLDSEIEKFSEFDINLLPDNIKSRKSISDQINIIMIIDGIIENLENKLDEIKNIS